jgi:hypothetical protein
LDTPHDGGAPGPAARPGPVCVLSDRLVMIIDSPGRAGSESPSLTRSHTNLSGGGGGGRGGP